MNRIICIGLMALPVYLHKGTPSFVSSSDAVMVKNDVTTFITYSINAQAPMPPWQISARDDQAEDCLRLGICKD